MCNRGFDILQPPIDLTRRPKRKKKTKTKGIKVVPNFIPKGWRVLRPMEEVEEGDYRWTKTGVTLGHYIPAKKIGKTVDYTITYIRRI